MSICSTYSCCSFYAIDYISICKIITIVSVFLTTTLPSTFTSVAFLITYVNYHKNLFHNLPPDVNPNCEQTTVASLLSKKSSQTVPYTLLMQTSTLPSMAVEPLTSLTPPSIQPGEVQNHFSYCQKLILYGSVVVVVARMVRVLELVSMGIFSLAPRPALFWLHEGHHMAWDLKSRVQAKR